MDEIKRLTGQAIEYEIRPMRAGDQLVYVTDYGKMQNDTAWQPTMTVRQTLDSIYDWWRCNPEDIQPRQRNRAVVAFVERFAGERLRPHLWPRPF